MKCIVDEMQIVLSAWLLPGYVFYGENEYIRAIIQAASGHGGYCQIF